MLVLLASILLAAPQGGARAQEPATKTPWQILQVYDRDGDGRITPAEYPRGEDRFLRLDTNEDGVITAADTKLLGRVMPGLKSRGGAGRRETPKDPAPAAGSLAPDFTLPILGADPPESMRLSFFRGRKPVALIFGSYT